MPDPASSQQPDLSNIATALDPFDTIVHLSVGSSGEIIRVHEGTLCKSSEYFKRAMKPEWKNSRSDPDSIDLSEDAKDAVTLYVQWLYSGSISVPPLSKDPQHGLDSRKYNEICMLLATSYIFGDKIMDIRFKNSILSTFLNLVNTLKCIPSSRVTATVYAGTVAGSGMRRLLIDTAASSVSSQPKCSLHLEDLASQCPEALLDVCKAMIGMIPSPRVVRKKKSTDYKEEEAT